LFFCLLKSAKLWLGKILTDDQGTRMVSTVWFGVASSVHIRQG